MSEIKFDEIKRHPILISPHTVVLLQLFHSKHDNLADAWTWDYNDALSEIDNAAAQFIAQLKDHWSPAFLMALRKMITEQLRQHDKEYGTNFAAEKE